MVYHIKNKPDRGHNDMAEAACYTLPIYEAVVCNLKIARRLAEGKPSAEPGEELLSEALRLQEKYRRVRLNLSSKAVSQASQETIIYILDALSTLRKMGPTLVARMRERVSEVDGKYHPMLKTVIADIEISLEKTDELAEAWSLGVNGKFLEELSNRLKDAQAPRRKDSDWRAVLASIHD